MSTRIYETRFYGPTNYRGARIKAQWQARKYVDVECGFEECWADKAWWVDYAHWLDTNGNHALAIRKAWPNAGVIRYGGETKQGYLWIVEEEEL